MWHLVSRATGPTTATAGASDPLGPWEVRYIRTWLEVLLNATTCRRSGPTQKPCLGLSKAGEVACTLLYFAHPCRLGWAWCSGGVTAFVCPPMSSNPPTATSCTRSRPPFHSTQLARPLALSLQLRPARVVCCVIPSITHKPTQRND